MPNDPHQLAELDARADRAVRALSAEVARRPVPRFDPDRALAHPVPRALAGRRPQHRALVAASVAAACIVLAGTVALWVGTGGEPGPASEVTTELPRPFVLAEVPGQLELLGVQDVTEPGEPGLGLEAPVHLYGPEPAEVALGAAVLDGYDAFDEAPSGELAPELVQVGGRAVQLYEDDGFGPLMVVAQVDGDGVALLGVPEFRDRLLALAGQVEVGERGPVFPDGALDDGWSQVGVEPSGVFLGSPTAMGGGARSVGRFAAYLAVSEDGVAASPMVVVSSLPADAARMAAPALAAAQLEEASVRGRRAQVAVAPTPDVVDEGGSTVTVSWLESDTELIRIHAVGLSPAEALALAEEVRPLGLDEWADLVEATQLDDRYPVDGEGTEIGRDSSDEAPTATSTPPGPGD